jgi:hypothetical protein
MSGERLVPNGILMRIEGLTWETIEDELARDREFVRANLDSRETPYSLKETWQSAGEDVTEKQEIYQTNGHKQKEEL